MAVRDSICFMRSWMVLLFMFVFGVFVFGVFVFCVFDLKEVWFRLK